MSFIHYLFLGHFEHDGERVRFLKRPSDSVFRPVIRRPLDVRIIAELLGKAKGTDAESLDFPEDWRIWLHEGYLVCDKYTRNPKAVNLISCFVERSGCDIYDVSAHCDITLNDWLAVTRSYAQP